MDKDIAFLSFKAISFYLWYIASFTVTSGVSLILWIFRYSSIWVLLKNTHICQHPREKKSYHIRGFVRKYSSMMQNIWYYVYIREFYWAKTFVDFPKQLSSVLQQVSFLKSLHKELNGTVVTLCSQHIFNKRTQEYLLLIKLLHLWVKCMLLKQR